MLLIFIFLDEWCVNYGVIFLASKLFFIKQKEVERVNFATDKKHVVLPGNFLLLVSLRRFTECVSVLKNSIRIRKMMK